MCVMTIMTQPHDDVHILVFHFCQIMEKAKNKTIVCVGYFIANKM